MDDKFDECEKFIIEYMMRVETVNSMFMKRNYLIKKNKKVTQDSAVKDAIMNIPINSGVINPAKVRRSSLYLRENVGNVESAQFFNHRMSTQERVDLAVKRNTVVKSAIGEFARQLKISGFPTDKKIDKSLDISTSRVSTGEFSVTTPPMLVNKSFVNLGPSKVKNDENENNNVKVSKRKTKFNNLY